MFEIEKIVGIGAGGHAKILIEIIEHVGKFELVGFTDSDQKKIGMKLMGYSVLGSDEELIKLYKAGVRKAFIGVGAVSGEGTRRRARLFHQAVELGFQMVSLVHPRALISPSVSIGAGSVVMAGAVVSAGVHLGDNVVIYSGAVIEHDSAIHSYVHLSPGVMIAGDVKILEGVFVGIGASVIQGVQLGAWATIGAGAVVLNDIPDGCIAVGMPARVVEPDEKKCGKNLAKKIDYV